MTAGGGDLLSRTLSLTRWKGGWLWGAACAETRVSATRPLPQMSLLGATGMVDGGWRPTPLGLALAMLRHAGWRAGRG